MFCVSWYSVADESVRVLCITNFWLLFKRVVPIQIVRNLSPRIHKRNFTKKLYGLCDLPYDERLAKCGLVTLELRRLRKDLGLCYQIVNGLIALNFVDFFTADTNRRTRGNRQKLKIPKLSHACSRAHFFSVRIVPVWNALTDDIILCGSYKQFCKLIETVDLTLFLKRECINSTINDSTI